MSRLGVSAQCFKRHLVPRHLAAQCMVLLQVWMTVLPCLDGSGVCIYSALSFDASGIKPIECFSDFSSCHVSRISVSVRMHNFSICIFAQYSVCVNP